MKPRKGYNPKRRLADAGAHDASALKDLADRCTYGGNPEHKRDAADYGLLPPASPRPGKTLCDAVRSVPRDEARDLLELGLRKGMISIQKRHGWPQNVWAVSPFGEVFEAQLENADQGAYHGYPMSTSDDFRAVVLNEWKRRG